MTDAVILQAALRSLIGTPGRQTEVAYRKLWEIIAGEMQAGRRVMIDCAGTFGLAPGHRGGSRWSTWWKPSAAFTTRVNAAEPPPPPPPPAEYTPRVVKPPIRPEDRALIAQWIKTRAAPETPAVSDIVFAPSHTRFWQAMTRDQAKYIVGSALRWFPVSATELGMTIEDGVRTYVPTLGRDQIIEFVHRWIAAANPRVSERQRRRCLELWPNEPPALHGGPWHAISRMAPMFFEWLEYTGRRPRGSNPFVHMTRPRMHTTKRRDWLDLTDIDTVLQHVTKPTVAPKVRMAVFLLANGLRRREARRIKLADLNLEQRGEVWVYGKGSAHSTTPGPKMRVVPLLPWTRQAIDEWLQTRADTTSPWLFPVRTTVPSKDDDGEGGGRAFSNYSFYALIKIAVNGAFPKNDPRRRLLTPHAFRNWYATRCQEHGVSTDHIMLTTGHASRQSLHTYLVHRPEQAKAAVLAAAATRWF